MTFIADYNGAIVWEAHPSNIGVGKNFPKVIVYHTPEEPADGYPGTPYWFAKEHPVFAGSTHYFASYLGFIWQCVPENRRAIANGVTWETKPYPVDTDPNISLNLQSISIEIEGYAATIGQTLSIGQRKALVEWTVYACKKYNIPADRQHIIGHYEVASNRSDPGTLSIDSIVAEVKLRLETQEDDMSIMDKTVKEVLPPNHPWRVLFPSRDDNSVGAEIFNILGYFDAMHLSTILTSIATLTTKVDALEAGGVDYAKLAKAVNDDAAARLKE